MCEKTDNPNSPDSFEIVVQKDDCTEILTLSADSELANFSEKEIKELSVLKNQLENLFHSGEPGEDGAAEGEYIGNCISRAISTFSLSGREADVLHLIADGRSNSDISERIHVSVSTVKKHVYNIFNKAGVNSRTQLLNLVFELEAKSRSVQNQM